MKEKSVSINDFRELNPAFAWTIKYHFDRHRHKVISGLANLFEESLQVKYRYDLSNCLIRIICQDVLLYEKEVFTMEDVNRAFKRASEEYFLIDLLRASQEIILFAETEKGKRCSKYSSSKKVIRTNHKGQKARWKERRVIKKGNALWHYYKRRPIPEADFSETNVDEFLPENEDAFFYDSPYYLFLDEGMSVLVESKGNIGAISFNPNYFSCDIKFIN